MGSRFRSVWRTWGAGCLKDSLGLEFNPIENLGRCFNRQFRRSAQNIDIGQGKTILQFPLRPTNGYPHLSSSFSLSFSFLFVPSLAYPLGWCTKSSFFETQISSPWVILSSLGQIREPKTRAEISRVLQAGNGIESLFEQVLGNFCGFWDMLLCLEDHSWKERLVVLVASYTILYVPLRARIFIGAKPPIYKAKKVAARTKQPKERQASPQVILYIKAFFHSSSLLSSLSPSLPPSPPSHSFLLWERGSFF